MKQKHSLIALAFLAVVGIASLAGVEKSDAQSPSGVDADTNIISFDVAEDMSRFVFDKDIAHEDGMPAHGSSFITQGYIYPAGTLDGSNGVLADGSPEFPDKVLGTWACRGWFIGDGAHAETGPMVLTTQHFVFGEDPGYVSLVTEGYELADVDLPIKRAVTGGTGPFENVAGEVEQVFLGFNAAEGVNLRIVAELENAGPGADYSLIPISQRRVSDIGAER